MNRIARMTLRTFALRAVAGIAFCAAAASAAGACASGGPGGAGAAGDVGKGSVRIAITTDAGVITADLDSAHAPVSVTNFLRYVDAGLYRDGRFHRTVRADNQPLDSVRIAVIQGARRTDRAVPSFAPIKLERTSTTGLRHRDGSLSMARNGPDSATDGFFICVGDQPALDFGGHRNLDGQGFAAFGRVISGMDVVRHINAAPAKAQNLTPPIRIIDIRRVP